MGDEDDSREIGLLREEDQNLFWDRERVVDRKRVVPKGLRKRRRRAAWTYFWRNYWGHPIFALRCAWYHARRPRNLATNEIWSCPACRRIWVRRIHITCTFGPP